MTSSNNSRKVVSLPNDISATQLRSISSTRSLKVKSVDLFKSNPRLKYLSPDLPPLPSQERGRTASRDDTLEFRHDGRGLFASKTVAELADELDTHGLRKLLDRDSKRYGKQRSAEELRSFQRDSPIPDGIPQVVRSSMRRALDDEDEEYIRQGYPYHPRYNPYADPGPSTIRPVSPGERISSFLSGSSRQFDSPNPYASPPLLGARAVAEEPEESVEPQDPKDNNLPPILLLGKDKEPDTTEQHDRTPAASPILLIAPNSAKSTSTHSTFPRSPPKQPVDPTHRASPIHILSKPLLAPRPHLAESYRTESAASTQDVDYETAEEYGSETPRDLSFIEPDADDEDTTEQIGHFNNQDIEDEEWHDSPVIPHTFPQQWTQRHTPKHRFAWTDLSSHHREDDDLDDEREEWESDDDEDPYNESIIDYAESSGPTTPIFPFTASHHPPRHGWGESPILALSIPPLPYPLETTMIPPLSRGSIESEGSWLSGKIDIEKAVRKSFATSSPNRRTPPIILETSPVVVSGGLLQSAMTKDGTSALQVAATNAKIWNSANPDYEGVDYGSSGDEGEARQRVRQGSKAKKVEVRDTPEDLEGMAARVSGDSPERSRTQEVMGEQDERRMGGIVLI